MKITRQFQYVLTSDPAYRRVVFGLGTDTLDALLRGTCYQIPNTSYFAIEVASIEDMDVVALHARMFIHALTRYAKLANIEVWPTLAIHSPRLYIREDAA
jgi:hypothetical protein